MIVGSVYNTVNKHPRNLPAEKNLSGIWTNSTLGPNGYNIIMFDDTAGQEYIGMRAQKDMKVHILNDELRTIEDNYATKVGSDRQGGVMTVTAAQSITLTVQSAGMAMSQIAMDRQSITLTVGPIPGMQSIIRMDATGITHTAPGGMTQLMIRPSGITNLGPMYTVTATATINLMAPTVNVGAELNTPSLVAGAAVVSAIDDGDFDPSPCEGLGAAP